MAEAKTKANAASIDEFIAAVEPATKREDARTLLALFERVTGAKAKMWGAAIIGFGEYRTTYASGRDVHWMRCGFSPRKTNLSIYLMCGYSDEINGERQAEALSRLGKHKTGKSCLYVNRLADVDMAVLEQMIAVDWATMARKYPD